MEVMPNGLLPWDESNNDVNTSVPDGLVPWTDNNELESIMPNGLLPWDENVDTLTPSAESPALPPSLSGAKAPQTGISFPEDTSPGAQALRKKIQEESYAKTIGREAGAGVVPTLGGLGGALAGAKGGALIGSAFGPFGTGAGALIGGVAGGIGGAYLGEKAQETVGEAIAPEAMAELQATRQAAVQERPIATFGASLAPQLIAFRPSIKNVTSAYQGAKALLAGKAVSKEAFDQMLNVGVGAGVNGAQEAYQQYQSGDTNAGRLLAQIVAGAIINEPNKFGIKMGFNPSTGEVEPAPVDIGAELRNMPVPEQAAVPVTDESRLIGRQAPGRQMPEIPEVLPPEPLSGAQVVVRGREPQQAIDVEPVSVATEGGRLIGRQASREMPDVASMADADVVELAKRSGLSTDGKPIEQVRSELMSQEGEANALQVGQTEALGAQLGGNEGVGIGQGIGVRQGKQGEGLAGVGEPIGGTPQEVSAQAEVKSRVKYVVPDILPKKMSAGAIRDELAGYGIPTTTRQKIGELRYLLDKTRTEKIAQEKRLVKLETPIKPLRTESSEAMMNRQRGQIDRVAGTSEKGATDRAAFLEEKIRSHINDGKYLNSGEVVTDQHGDTLEVIDVVRLQNDKALGGQYLDYELRNQRTGDIVTRSSKDLRGPEYYPEDVPFQTRKTATAMPADLPTQRATTRDTMKPLGGTWVDGKAADHIGTWSDGKGTTIDFRHEAVGSPKTGPRAGEFGMGKTLRTGENQYTVSVDPKTGDITTPPHELAEIVGITARQGLSEPYANVVSKALKGIDRDIDLNTTEGAHKFATIMETASGRNKVADALLKASPGAQQGFKKWINKIIQMVNTLFRSNIPTFQDANFKQLANGMRDFTALNQLVTAARSRGTTLKGAIGDAALADSRMTEMENAVTNKLKDKKQSVEKFRDWFGSKWVDWNAPVFRRIREDIGRGGEAAKAAVNRVESFLRASRGASGKAVDRSQASADALIKAGIKTRDDKVQLDRYRLAKRIIEVNEVMSEKARQERLQDIRAGKWTDADEALFLKTIDEDKIQSGGITSDQAKAWLAESQKQPWFKKVEDANKIISDEYRTNLKMMLDEGLLKQSAYDKLIQHENYQPRLFLEHFDPVVDTQRGGRFTVHDSGVQSLKMGSDSPMVNDSIYLLQRNTAHTEGIVARNRANRELYNFAKLVPDNKLGLKLTDPDKAVPAGYEKIEYRESGENKAMLIPSDLAKYWRTSDPAMNEAAAKFFRNITGVSTLKAMATGLNPEFAIPSFFRDLGSTWLASNNYSPFLPKAWAQQMRNFVSSMTPSRRKILNENFIKHGGSREFLSSMSDALDPMSMDPKRQAVNKAIKIMGKIGNETEKTTYLMLTEQALKNANKTIQNASDEDWRKAVYEASNYLDFRQHGQYTKVLDQFIPFANPAMQGVRVVGRAFKEHPATTSMKAAQIMALGAYVAWWNRQNNPKTWDELSDDQKNTGANFALPMTVKDKDGVERGAVTKIQLDQGWRPFFVLGEMVAEKMAGKDVDPDRLKQVIAANYAPVDLQALPPFISAMFTYTQNHDLWTKEKVWRGAKVEPEMEQRKTTPTLAVKVGEATGLSPERLTAATKKAIPNNPWTWGLAEGVDWFGQPAEDKVRQDNFARWADKPGFRKLFRMTPARELKASDIKEANKYKIPVEGRAVKSVLDDLEKREVARNTQRQKNKLRLESIADSVKAGKATKVDLMREIQSIKDANGRPDRDEISNMRKYFRNKYPELKIPAPWSSR